jgi:hypothetical protein
MSLATEQTFRNAVALAEGPRQQSKAAARVTYAYDPANLAAYKIALAAADVAYFTAVNTAANTLAETSGNTGMNGPIPGAGWTPLLAMA